jgi:hypothetical protein
MLVRVKIAQVENTKISKANQGLTIVTIVISENMDQLLEPQITSAYNALKEHTGILMEPSMLMPVRIVHRVAMGLSLELNSRFQLIKL